MANLEFCDKHNMVAYLKKPTGSEGFQEIVYFLNGCHISEPIPNVPDEAVYEEWDDKVERATTTATSLDAEHTSGNINRTQSMAMPNVPLSQGIGAGGSPSMTLLELIVLRTTLSKKVESLETDLKQTKKVYGAAYTKLIKKVKKLEKTVKSNQARRAKRLCQEDQPEDQLRVFSAAKVLADVAKENVYTYTRRRKGSFIVNSNNHPKLNESHKEIKGDIKEYWEILPKKYIGRYYPKRYWEILPKEILGDITQRDTKEILGDTTQIDISMYLGNNISG
ncbi:hypothetical protein Tco_0955385 [Tanacetum coccineum]|uniref:Transposase n=1 Tax=Tanacetum coccineum TaxID=301880 RepID=A0ABQ5E738_9ASTR